MSLETTLADTIAPLRHGRFPNEQSISQGIVLRVLQELGWEIYNSTVVWPDFRTGEGRADFALCHRRRPKTGVPTRNSIHGGSVEFSAVQGQLLNQP
jgi:hypothetical protein